MKKLLLTILTLSTVMYGCRKETSSSNYDVLKKKGYTQLNSSEKLEFKSDLSHKLKSDENYKKWDKVDKLLAEQFIDRIKSKDTKPTRKNFKKLSDYRDYYRAKGIKNPDLYLKRTIQKFIYIAKVKKAFPELATLDKDSRKIVLKDASTPFTKVEIARIVKNREHLK
jgi:alpha-D-ribose 1-methylphosphonate 5-triphosphate diphosphatase PhnM